MSPERHPPRPSGNWSPSEDYLDRTIEVWQPSSKRKITREDAHEIATNMAGFLQVLLEWKREDEALAPAKLSPRPLSGPNAFKKQPLS